MKHNPKCFGTDPNLPDCECRMIYIYVVERDQYNRSPHTDPFPPYQEWLKEQK